MFGDVVAKDPATVLKNWEQIKLKEKDGNRSILAGVPRALPALVKAFRVQEKAANAGFDWEKPEDVKFVLCTRLTDELNLLKRNYHFYVEQLRAPAASDNLVIDIIQRKIRDVILSAPEPEDYEALLDKVAKEFREGDNG